MRGAPSKEVRRVIKHAEDLGFYVKRDSKHYILRHPRGHTYPVPRTPKNRTAFEKSAIRELNRFDCGS